MTKDDQFWGGMIFVALVLLLAWIFHESDENRIAKHKFRLEAEKKELKAWFIKHRTSDDGSIVAQQKSLEKAKQEFPSLFTEFGQTIILLNQGDLGGNMYLILLSFRASCSPSDLIGDYTINSYTDSVNNIENLLLTLKEEVVKKKRSRTISQSVKDKVWNRDGGKCVQCSSNENLEFDHIIPHSKGGANTYRNIQLLCEPCNRSKSAKIG